MGKYPNGKLLKQNAPGTVPASKLECNKEDMALAPLHGRCHL